MSVRLSMRRFQQQILLFGLAPCVLSTFLLAQELAALRFTKFVCPAYPPLAQTNHREGTVLIELMADKHGLPVNIQVLEGEPMFMSATLEAARQWRFRPYRLGGERVEVSMRVRVSFALQPRSQHRCTIGFPARLCKESCKGRENAYPVDKNRGPFRPAIDY